MISNIYSIVCQLLVTGLKVAVLLHSLWAVSLLLFVLSDQLPVPRYCHPLLLYTIMAAFLLNPTRRCIIIIIIILITITIIIYDDPRQPGA